MNNLPPQPQKSQIELPEHQYSHLKRAIAYLNAHYPGQKFTNAMVQEATNATKQVAPKPVQRKPQPGGFRKFIAETVFRPFISQPTKHQVDYFIFALNKEFQRQKHYTAEQLNQILDLFKDGKAWYEFSTRITYPRQLLENVRDAFSEEPSIEQARIVIYLLRYYRFCGPDDVLDVRAIEKSEVIHSYAFCYIRSVMILYIGETKSLKHFDFEHDGNALENSQLFREGMDMIFNELI